MFAKKMKNRIKGTIVIDPKTKDLLKRIRPGQIAIIHHEDIDEMAARDLVTAKVKAVINTAPSITGSYMSIGANILLHYHIPLYDCKNKELMTILKDNQIVEIKDQSVILMNQSCFPLKAVSKQEIEEKWQYAKKNMGKHLSHFIENTLTYAQKEKDDYLTPLPTLPIVTKLYRNHVLLVVRGKHYREDLRAVRSYIHDFHPVLIGVDGGADALLEEGFTPHMIIGDMDSVTDQALRSGAEIIVHAYPGGHAPAKQRMEELGVSYFTLPATGTSEDIAMLYAYEQGAEWIVTLGAHSNMIDFLEKGRKGMSSTVLVRMKVGTKLIDAKGVSMLYQKRLKWGNLFLIGSAAAVPVVAAGIISPAVREFVHLLWLQIKFF
ncbi:MAG TPA: putative cytokinetic ring protein SteA [Bacillota bacterium]|nr:putative cytokinetic ring protein SteA [Bacillota bacterium]